ncbi:hypothetical protein BKA64DRAFT_107921 [Cadophora sp. MPI-SDFR-AT-0126]|nr:hypothetical protein BKA64DRAFT_107921 [Leotiomycetes sp. MPI-SDFR-AT-0126]
MDRTDTCEAATDTSFITDTTTATDTSFITDSTTTTTTSISTLLLTTTTTLPASTVTSSISGSLTTVVIPPITETTTETSLITLPGEVTTLPGEVTTLPGDITTLPGEVTTLSGVTTTVPGVITTITAPGSTVLSTLPGQVTTLPGEVTTITAPGSTVLSTLPGQVTTVPGEVTTVTAPGSTVLSTLPGQVTTLPGQVTTVTAPGPTVTLPPVSDTVTVPGPTIVGPGVTVTVNGLVVCPKPTNTPGVVVTPQDTGPNALWGCSPGYVCDLPKPAGCTLFADPPDYDFLCDAKYCIPSPPFPTVVWPEGETSYYPLTEGYFNLNPQAFGLDFTIFVINVVVITVTGEYGKETVKTVTTGDYSSQASLAHFGSTDIPSSILNITPSPTPTSKTYVYPTSSAHAHWKKARDVLHLLKRDESIVPAVCYATCNNCYLEAQSVGLSPELCADGSAFRSSYEACQNCVAANSATPKDSLQVYVDPKFAIFIDFCETQAPIPVVEPSTSTSTATVVPVPATQSVVVATETAPTPTTSVEITSQVPAVTSSNPVPIATSTSSNPEPIPSTTSSSPPTSTSGLVQITGNVAASSTQSSFALMVSILLPSILALLL